MKPMIRRLTPLAITTLTILALVSVALTLPFPALAGGATRISGIGFFAGSDVCPDTEDLGADFAVGVTGDLEGCLYTFVETAVCSPSGTYVETGHELFVQDGGGGNTFGTTYRFEAKYQDCANLGGEIIGRCQHPIVAGSGTGDFAGVSGRLDFKDDIAAGNFPFIGYLRY